METTARFGAALQWAEELHRGQDRKASASRVPYIAHVLAVAALTLEDGASEDTAIAAVLHDTIEDCGVSADEIDERFGPAVARVVEECTDTDEVPKPRWRPRKERFVARLDTDATSREALVVVAADKLHNVQSILDGLERVGPTMWEQFSAPPGAQYWYYDVVSSIIERRLTASALPGQLRRAVERMRRIVQP